MTLPCPGGCNTAYRATGQGDPQPGDPVWCHADTARIRTQLTQLDDLAAMWEYQVTGFHEQGRNPARGGNTPSPSPAMDDVLELTKTLTEWEAAYREWHNARNPGRPWLTAPYRGVLCTVLHGTVCWLTQNLGGVLASDMAEDFGREIGVLHREFMGKTRAGTGRRRSYVPCPACDLRLLAWVDGYDGLICANCNRHVPKAEHDELADAARHELEHA